MTESAVEKNERAELSRRFLLENHGRPLLGVRNHQAGSELWTEPDAVSQFHSRPSMGPLFALAHASACSSRNREDVKWAFLDCRPKAARRQKSRFIVTYSFGSPRDYALSFWPVLPAVTISLESLPRGRPLSNWVRSRGFRRSPIPVRPFPPDRGRSLKLGPFVLVRLDFMDEPSEYQRSCVQSAIGFNRSESRRFPRPQPVRIGFSAAVSLKGGLASIARFSYESDLRRPPDRRSPTFLQFTTNRIMARRILEIHQAEVGEVDWSWAIRFRRSLSEGMGRGGRGGISSWVAPSSSRPVRFLRTPPHCLKKNGTPAARHWSRIERTQSGSIGRAPWPLSPPTITQWMPVEVERAEVFEQRLDREEPHRRRGGSRGARSGAGRGCGSRR